MLQVICVRQGEKYGIEYVRRLHAMVARNLTAGMEGTFTCFTDRPNDDYGPHIQVRELPNDLQGWWCKLWLFSPGLFPAGDRILYFDLDTVIVGDLDRIAAYDGQFAILKDFYRKSPQENPRWQSSVMAWSAGTCHVIWELWDFQGRPEPLGGDQEFIERCRNHIPRYDYWQDLFPGLFCSFKVHCKPFPPEGTSVVVFHGEPRPHNCGVSWVDAMWTEGDAGHFQLAMIQNVTLDQIKAQTEASSKLGLKRLKSQAASDRVVALIGGGPSLGDPISLVEIIRLRNDGAAIWAMNGSYNWLLSHGITADAIVIVDARRENVRFLSDLRPETKRYVASQCAPEVFSAVGADAIYVDQSVMGDCGTTVGTHAICIAFVEGFRKIHLYGYDSSYRSDEGHAYTQEMSAERIVDAHCGDKMFRAEPWMVRQVQDFQSIAADFTGAGAEIIVHGDGLLPYAAWLMANPPPAAHEIRANEILKRLNGAEKPIGAEIGVFKGAMSRALLEKNEKLRLLMVDSWEGDGAAYKTQTGDFHSTLSEGDQENCLEMARSQVEFARDRAHIVRFRSIKAAAHTADRSLDFVFIDADHSYEGCRDDIAAWYSKVRPHGFIGGHDYANYDFPQFGVQRAVDEFAASIGQKVDLGENFTWFLRKE
jgi:hypothetical protein